MIDLNFVLLYVSTPLESAAFYQQLLGKAPVEQSPTFALFALDSGVMLGLWAKETVIPVATPVGGSELAFAQKDTHAVDALYTNWRDLGLPIIQHPVQMDFGYTFVAQDPDGHRLRVFTPNEAR